MKNILVVVIAAVAILLGTYAAGVSASTGAQGTSAARKVTAPDTPLEPQIVLPIASQDASVRCGATVPVVDYQDWLDVTTGGYNFYRVRLQARGQGEVCLELQGSPRECVTVQAAEWQNVALEGEYTEPNGPQSIRVLAVAPQAPCSPLELRAMQVRVLPNR